MDLVVWLYGTEIDHTSAVKRLSPEVVVVVTIREPADHVLFDRISVQSVHIGRDLDETR